MKFKSVSKKNMCPACSGTSWCSFSDDGEYLLCRRQYLSGATVKKDMSRNEYYVYRMETF